MQHHITLNITNWMTITLSLLFIGLIACKQDKVAVEKPVESSAAVVTPEGFDAFYTKFHTDSLYQLDHILFPIPEQQSGDAWMKESWKMHHDPFENPIDLIREIRDINGLVIEVVYHKLGFYLVERRFMPRGDDSWDMIYYAQRTNLDDWEKQYDNDQIDISPVNRQSSN